MKQKLLLLLSAAMLTAVVFISCSKDTAGASLSITTLDCAGVTFSAIANANVAYNGMAAVNYTGGNGLAYTSGTPITSTGVTGLTATLTAGTLATGAGTLFYTITGTATVAGNANFALTFGGKNCSIVLVVH